MDKFDADDKELVEDENGGEERQQWSNPIEFLLRDVTYSVCPTIHKKSSYLLPRQVDRTHQIQVNERLLQFRIVTLYMKLVSSPWL